MFACGKERERLTLYSPWKKGKGRRKGSAWGKRAASTTTVMGLSMILNLTEPT